MSILQTLCVAFQGRVCYHFLSLVIYLQQVHLRLFSAKDLVTPFFQGWHEYTLRLFLLFPTGEALAYGILSLSLVCDPVLCISSFSLLLLLQSFRLSVQFILYDFLSSPFYWGLTGFCHSQMLLAYSEFLYQSVKHIWFQKHPLKHHQ